jgi:hypothetical protein
MINFISIRAIVDSLRDHPLLQDVSLERVVAYTVDFLRILGMNDIFEEKVETIKLQEHRAALPCDLHEIIQIRRKKDKRVYRPTTNNFHTADCGEDFTYKRQGPVIFTSTKEGELEIAYKAMVVDGEGLPMVPDNSSVIRALELYIKKAVFTIQFDLGKVNNQVLQQTQADYAWAVAHAKNELITPTEDEMESLTNSLNNLVPKSRVASTGFRTLSY